MIESVARNGGNLQADILIAGGGVGGCAAALAATDMGMNVVLTEETDWLGGQLTSQMVPPDDNPWITGYEFGCTSRYRRYREAVRRYYRDHYPISPETRTLPRWNPGAGRVGGLCHEPRVGVAVIDQLLAFARASGKLRTLMRYRPVAVETTGDKVRSVAFRHTESGKECIVEARYILDATELGDLLPLAGAEYVTGAEAQRETGEEHARPTADPDDVQSFTWCFAMGFDPTPGVDYTIDKPADYDVWRDFRPTWNPEAPPLFDLGKRALFPPADDSDAFSWWTYRRIVTRQFFEAGRMPREVTVVNWPQNDYLGGTIIDKPEQEVARHLAAARELSRSLLYYLQAEVPRPDGGQGYPGLHLCPEIAGTDDGLAKAPYIRESRRIRAVFTITENDLFPKANGMKPGKVYDDTVGIGSYPIDIHASHRSQGDYLGSGVFHIPLGALVPIRLTNLLPACKNIGTTHVTNGCYRLHPVEWNIGEAAGALAAWCINRHTTPMDVHQDTGKLKDFQNVLAQQGVELLWPCPNGIPVGK